MWEVGNDNISKKDSYNQTNQDSFMNDLSGKNWGKLLFKKWTDPKLLTETEAAYLERHETPDAMAMVATGAYCRVNGKVEEIRKAVIRKAGQI